MRKNTCKELTKDLTINQRDKSQSPDTLEGSKDYRIMTQYPSWIAPFGKLLLEFNSRGKYLIPKEIQVFYCCFFSRVEQPLSCFPFRFSD